MASVYGTTNSDILNAADGVTSGDDYVYGGDGHDTIRGLGGGDNLFGDDGRDRLFGGTGNDWLEGGEGNDDLFGGDNDDYLWGDEGDDELYGEDNDDYLDGGAGADTLEGGVGIDTAGYLGSPAGVFVSLYETYGGAWWGDAEGDWLNGIENLWGSKFNDVLWGNNYQDNALNGFQGNDILRGFGGDDSIDGGDGHDELYGYGDRDTLNGGSGNDRLEGGMGGDTMSGGSGADTFAWMYTAESDGTSWKTDIITDFNRAEGDLIDLHGIDADVYAAGNQPFTFIGDASHPFTAPGQISFAHAAGNPTNYTQIFLNTDADAEADGVIKVSEMYAVDGNWFVL
jgi:serralysin